MSKACYKVIDGATRKIKKKYKVVDGVTREITKKYVVVNGLARLCYESVKAISTVLSENTWPQIAAVSASGKAQEYWSVGDTKTEMLNGKTYTFRIVGFDHDDLVSYDDKYDEPNYNGGKNKAGITFEMVELFETSLEMHGSATNSVGWLRSKMNLTHMETMKGYMPTELQGVLRTVNKLTSSGNKESTIEIAENELFLFSEVEICGVASQSFAGEGEQYAYYAAGNRVIKYKPGSSSANYWWLRSPYKSASSSYLRILPGGTFGYNVATNTNGVSFGFCL